MLESDVPHFFPKMHLKVYREPFSVYASSLFALSCMRWWWDQWAAYLWEHQLRTHRAVSNARCGRPQE